MKASLFVPSLILLHVCSCKAGREEVIINHFGGHLTYSRRAEIRNGAVATVQRVMKDMSGNICGGPTIRELIGKKSDLSSIRTVNWDKVMKIADDYLKEESDKIIQLTSEVEALQDKLKTQQQLEEFVPISKDSISSLLTQAVNSGYGELKHAQQSFCGYTPIRSKDASGKRIRIGTLAQQQQSKTAFETEARSYFEAKKEKVDPNSFQDVCMQLLNPEMTDVSKTYCDEFCLDLAIIVQDASDPSAHTSGVHTVEEISRQLEEKNEELKFAVGRESDCQRAKQNLESFNSELTSLSTEIDTNYKSMLVAQDEFDEADFAFEDLQADLERQEETTKEIQAIFAKNEQAATAASAAFDEVETKKKVVHVQLEQTMEHFSKAKEALSKASAADRAVNELKMAVSSTMLNMVVYFDEAVRAPMLNLGFDIDMKISDYFENDMKSMDSASEVAKSVKALSDLCETEAKPSFQEVQDKVDLSPMCALGGTVEEISQGIDQAVLSRANLVQMNLETALSFLNPYKGQPGMTLAKAQERVDAGEPKGLQEVKSVFKMTPIWQYLQNWQLDGTLLPLYTKLGHALKELTNAKAQVESEVQETHNNLQNLVGQSLEAKSVLEKAILAMGASGELKEDAEKALALLKQESADQEQVLNKMFATFEQALKTYEEAKTNLEKAHSHGMSASMIENSAVGSIKKHMGEHV